MFDFNAEVQKVAQTVSDIVVSFEDRQDAQTNQGGGQGSIEALKQAERQTEREQATGYQLPQLEVLEGSKPAPKELDAIQAHPQKLSPAELKAHISSLGKIDGLDVTRLTDLCNSLEQFKKIQEIMCSGTSSDSKANRLMNEVDPTVLQQVFGPPDHRYISKFLETRSDAAALWATNACAGIDDRIKDEVNGLRTQWKIAQGQSAIETLDEIQLGEQSIAQWRIQQKIETEYLTKALVEFAEGTCSSDEVEKVLMDAFAHGNRQVMMMCAAALIPPGSDTTYDALQNVPKETHKLAAAIAEKSAAGEQLSKLFNKAFTQGGLDKSPEKLVGVLGLAIAKGGAVGAELKEQLKSHYNNDITKELTSILKQAGASKTELTDIISARLISKGKYLSKEDIQPIYDLAYSGTSRDALEILLKCVTSTQAEARTVGEDFVKDMVDRGLHLPRIEEWLSKEVIPNAIAEDKKVDPFSAKAWDVIERHQFLNKICTALGDKSNAQKFGHAASDLQRVKEVSKRPTPKSDDFANQAANAINAAPMKFAFKASDGKAELAINPAALLASLERQPNRIPLDLTKLISTMEKLTLEGSKFEGKLEGRLSLASVSDGPLGSVGAVDLKNPSFDITADDNQDTIRLKNVTGMAVYAVGVKYGDVDTISLTRKTDASGNETYALKIQYKPKQISFPVKKTIPVPDSNPEIQLPPAAAEAFKKLLNAARQKPDSIIDGVKDQLADSHPFLKNFQGIARDGEFFRIKNSAPLELAELPVMLGTDAKFKFRQENNGGYTVTDISDVRLKLPLPAEVSGAFNAKDGFEVEKISIGARDKDGNRKLVLEFAGDLKRVELTVTPDGKPLLVEGALKLKTSLNLDGQDLELSATVLDATAANPGRVNITLNGDSAAKRALVKRLGIPEQLSAAADNLESIKVEGNKYEFCSSGEKEFSAEGVLIHVDKNISISRHQHPDGRQDLSISGVTLQRFEGANRAVRLLVNQIGFPAKLEQVHLNKANQPTFLKTDEWDSNDVQLIGAVGLLLMTPFAAKSVTMGGGSRR